MAQETGNRLAHFSYIAKGSFALVYAAHLESNGERVAVKVLKPEFHSDEGHCQRFFKEVGIQAMLNHRNLVKLHGLCTLPLSQLIPVTPPGILPHTASSTVGVPGAMPSAHGTATGSPSMGSPLIGCAQGGMGVGIGMGMGSNMGGGAPQPVGMKVAHCWAAVMEAMTDGTLYDLLQVETGHANSPLGLYSLADAVQWLVEVADAMQYLHSRQPMLIHRDIKPENIMLAREPVSGKGSSGGTSASPMRRRQEEKYVAKIGDLGLLVAVDMATGKKVKVERLVQQRQQQQQRPVGVHGHAATESMEAPRAPIPSHLVIPHIPPTTPSPPDSLVQTPAASSILDSQTRVLATPFPSQSRARMQSVSDNSNVVSVPGTLASHLDEPPGAGFLEGPRSGGGPSSEQLIGVRARGTSSPGNSVPAVAGEERGERVGGRSTEVREPERRSLWQQRAGHAPQLSADHGSNLFSSGSSKAGLAATKPQPQQQQQQHSVHSERISGPSSAGGQHPYQLPPPPPQQQQQQRSHLPDSVANAAGVTAGGLPTQSFADPCPPEPMSPSTNSPVAAAPLLSVLGISRHANEHRPSAFCGLGRGDSLPSPLAPMSPRGGRSPTQRTRSLSSSHLTPRTGSSFLPHQSTPSLGPSSFSDSTSGMPSHALPSDAPCPTIPPQSTHGHAAPAGLPPPPHGSAPAPPQFKAVCKHTSNPDLPLWIEPPPVLDSGSHSAPQLTDSLELDGLLGTTQAPASMPPTPKLPHSRRRGSTSHIPHTTTQASSRPPHTQQPSSLPLQLHTQPPPTAQSILSSQSLNLNQLTTHASHALSTTHTPMRPPPSTPPTPTPTRCPSAPHLQQPLPQHDTQLPVPPPHHGYHSQDSLPEPRAHSHQRLQDTHLQDPTMQPHVHTLSHQSQCHHGYSSHAHISSQHAPLYKPHSHRHRYHHHSPQPNPNSELTSLHLIWGKDLDHTSQAIPPNSEHVPPLPPQSPPHQAHHKPDGGIPPPHSHRSDPQLAPLSPPKHQPAIPQAAPHTRALRRGLDLEVLHHATTTTTPSAGSCQALQRGEPQQRISSSLPDSCAPQHEPSHPHPHSDHRTLHPHPHSDHHALPPVASPSQPHSDHHILHHTLHPHPHFDHHALPPVATGHAAAAAAAAAAPAAKGGGEGCVVEEGVQTSPASSSAVDSPVAAAYGLMVRSPTAGGAPTPFAAHPPPPPPPSAPAPPAPAPPPASSPPLTSTPQLSPALTPPLPHPHLPSHLASPANTPSPCTTPPPLSPGFPAPSATAFLTPHTLPPSPTTPAHCAVPLSPSTPPSLPRRPDAPTSCGDYMPSPTDQRFVLTGRCGSLLYMSPEVARGKPYNEKADVFSFAILAWELLGRSLLSAGLPPGDTDAMLGYVAKVAWQGWRPALPFYWPTELKLLVSLCWHEDPRLRPSFATILTKLQAMQQTGDVAQLVAAEAPLLLGPARHPATRQHQASTSSSTATRQKEGSKRDPHGHQHHQEQQQQMGQDARKNFLWKLLPERMRQGTSHASQHEVQQQQQQQQHPQQAVHQHARKHHHVQQEVKQQLVEHLKQTKAMMLEQLSSKSPQQQKDS